MRFAWLVNLDSGAFTLVYAEDIGKAYERFKVLFPDREAYHIRLYHAKDFRYWYETVTRQEWREDWPVPKELTS